MAEGKTCCLLKFIRQVPSTPVLNAALYRIRVRSSAFLSYFFTYHADTEGVLYVSIATGGLAEVHRNSLQFDTRVLSPLLLLYACVSVCCSAEVTGSADTLCWIMNTVLSKYQRPSLSDGFRELFLISGRARGQYKMRWTYRNYPGNATCSIIFFLISFLLGGETLLGLIPLGLTDAARDNNVVASK